MGESNCYHEYMSTLTDRKIVNVLMFSDDPENKHTVLNGNRGTEVLLGHVSWEKLKERTAQEIWDLSDDHHPVFLKEQDGKTLTSLYQLADVECWFKVIEISPMNKHYYFVAYDDVEYQTGDIDESE